MNENDEMKKISMRVEETERLISDVESQVSSLESEIDDKVDKQNLNDIIFKIVEKYWDEHFDIIDTNRLEGIEMELSEIKEKLERLEQRTD